MGRAVRIPSPSEIRDDTPLLLDVAAKIAFPDGSLSGLALRNAAARNELTYERIGGRLYTTLGDIKEMRKQCRGRAKGPAFGLSEAMSEPTENESSEHGPSKTMEVSESAQASALLMVERLRQKLTTPSRDTSSKNGRLRGKSAGRPMLSRSPT